MIAHVEVTGGPDNLARGKYLVRRLSGSEEGGSDSAASFGESQAVRAGEAFAFTRHAAAEEITPAHKITHLSGRLDPTTGEAQVLNIASIRYADDEITVDCEA